MFLSIPDAHALTPEAITLRVAARWLSEGRRMVIATLVDYEGSAPLPTGATMLIDDAGNVEGSVTGGCVEGALVEEAESILAGAGPRLCVYGISDELAGSVGLTCGGTVRIFVAEVAERDKPTLTTAIRAAADDQPVALATMLDGDGAGNRLALLDGQVVGSIGAGSLLEHNVVSDAGGLLAQGISMVRSYGRDGATMGDERRVFVQVFAPSPRMIIFGAIDFSAALAALAQPLGYRVTICDARPRFTTSSRYSKWAEVVNDWPDRFLEGQQLSPRDTVLVFTHDPKFDEPALIAALRTDAGYIGALGSRRTQRDRMLRLAAAGVTQESLSRIASPCGLDIGAVTPAETAISVLAEIIAVRTGHRAERLMATEGPIRPRTPDVGL